MEFPPGRLLIAGIGILCSLGRALQSKRLESLANIGVCCCSALLHHNLINDTSYLLSAALSSPESVGLVFDLKQLPINSHRLYSVFNNVLSLPLLPPAIVATLMPTFVDNTNQFKAKK